MKENKVVIVGGGPAGMMAAIRAAFFVSDVTLIEKNASLGRKLLLSGKGRCNLTNACELEQFLKRFSGNGQFLRDAFKKFFNHDLIDFFEQRGLELKTERQQRVFPVTDNSASILDVIKKELFERKINILYKTSLKDIIVENGAVKGIKTNSGDLLTTGRLILACGGVSYAFTGSNGGIFDIVRKTGHKIIDFKPGLVPLQTKQNYKLNGLTLKNIRLTFNSGSKKIVSDIGEMLFTDFGISGPLVLSLSAKVADWLDSGSKVYVEIDFKPALSEEQLNQRLLRERKINSRKSVKNALRDLLPVGLIDVFLKLSGIPANKQYSQLKRQERHSLIVLLKGLRLDIIKTMPIEEAMVSRGGVSLKEINPRTMESRIIKGLYFSGEMIDIDADTGGFNLQAAFSTGYLAGESAAAAE